MGLSGGHSGTGRPEPLPGSRRLPATTSCQARIRSSCSPRAARGGRGATPLRCFAAPLSLRGRRTLRHRPHGSGHAHLRPGFQPPRPRPLKPGRSVCMTEGASARLRDGGVEQSRLSGRWMKGLSAHDEARAFDTGVLGPRLRRRVSSEQSVIAQRASRGSVAGRHSADRCGGCGAAAGRRRAAPPQTRRDHKSWTGAHWRHDPVTASEVWGES